MCFPRSVSSAHHQGGGMLDKGLQFVSNRAVSLDRLRRDALYEARVLKRRFGVFFSTPDRRRRSFALRVRSTAVERSSAAARSAARWSETIPDFARIVRVERPIGSGPMPWPRSLVSPGGNGASIARAPLALAAMPNHGGRAPSSPAHAETETAPATLRSRSAANRLSRPEGRSGAFPFEPSFLVSSFPARGT